MEWLIFISFPELVEQLGIIRCSHQPRVAGTFCGSGQISFEAARLGCDVYASDLNPVACLLTWGACNIAGMSATEMEAAETGIIGRERKYGEAHLMHQVGGVNYQTKISTLRGDYQRPDGTIDNRLRQWELDDFKPRPEDIFQERLYCVQWMCPKQKGKGYDYEFRGVTHEDLKRERIVKEFIAKHLADWQAQGWVPDMQIEVGGPPRYQGLDLIRARGWTYWHHLFKWSRHQRGTRVQSTYCPSRCACGVSSSSSTERNRQRGRNVDAPFSRRSRNRAMMEYKGYLANITFEAQANLFHGEVINIRDVVTFQGQSVDELRSLRLG